MFQCKHKRRKEIGMTLQSDGVIANTKEETNLVVSQPVYMCRDCRVLFCPIEDERIRTNS